MDRKIEESKIVDEYNNNDGGTSSNVHTNVLR